MNEYEEFDSDNQVISKSQRKRELQQLLALTEQALTLTDEKLAQTGINEKALGAFKDARKMKASGARNRQLKYISKLIRSDDIEILTRYLDEASQAEANARQFFHQLERWRDRFIAEGDGVLGEFLGQYPQADRQQLRTLIRQAQKEKQAETAPVAARKLFKYLRSLAENTI